MSQDDSHMVFEIIDMADYIGQMGDVRGDGKGYHVCVFRCPEFSRCPKFSGCPERIDVWFLEAFKWPIRLIR